MSPPRDDRGTVAGELVVLAVVFFLLVAVNVLVGRLNVGSAHVEGAARMAARTISMARDPQSAVDEAEAEAARTVDEGSPMCQSMQFEPPDIDIPGGTVTVRIECSVDLSAAVLLDVPGSLTVDGEAEEVIDQYRETEGT